MSKTAVTYIPYTEGQEAKHLHLGNLVHDFRHPNDYDPYEEKAYTDISETAPEWAESTPLQNYALTVGQESDRYQVVASAKATQIEIKDPKKFFNEITLQSPSAKKWLTLRLSAAELLEDGQPRPQVWLLTGLVLMTHATWTSISSSETFTPGVKAPFDPTGVSSIRRLSVSESVKPVVGFKDEPKKHVSGATIHETGKYPGLRGWAARWERVDVKVLPGENWTEAPGHLKLRLDEGVRKFAAVELKSGNYAKAGDGKDFGDDFWEEFLDDADEDA